LAGLVDWCGVELDVFAIRAPFATVAVDFWLYASYDLGAHVCYLPPDCASTDISSIYEDKIIKTLDAFSKVTSIAALEDRGTGLAGGESGLKCQGVVEAGQTLGVVGAGAAIPDD
jgi:hypothetical protein